MSDTIMMMGKPMKVTKESCHERLTGPLRAGAGDPWGTWTFPVFWAGLQGGQGESTALRAALSPALITSIWFQLQHLPEHRGGS